MEIKKKTKIVILLIIFISIILYLETAPTKLLVNKTFKNFETKNKANISINLNLDMMYNINQPKTESIPITMNIQANYITDKTSSCIKGEIVGQSFGTSTDKKINTFYDLSENIKYDYNEENEVWIKNEQKTNDAFNKILSNFKEDVFNNVKRVKHKPFEYYIFQQKISYQDFIKIMNHSISIIDDLSEILNDKQINVNFYFSDITKSIQKIEFCFDDETMNDLNINKFNLTIDILSLSKNINVEIPQIISEKSKESDEVQQETEANIEDKEIKTKVEEIVESTKPNNLTTDINGKDGVSLNLPSQNDSNEIGENDTLGSYNNTNFTKGFPFSLFVADGWFSEKDEGTHTFLIFENEKYENTTFMLYDEEEKGTIESLNKNGVWGYEVDASLSDKLKPNMKWNGLTWGATETEIIEKYGEQYNIHESEKWNAYEYDIDKETTLTFYVYKDEGLKKVRCFSYKWHN